MKKYAFLFFMLSFCSISNAYSETKEDYEKVYTIVQNEYVENISLERFIAAGVKSLMNVDKNLKVEQGYDDFTFIFANGKRGVFRKPRDKKSPAGWAESITRMVDNVVRISPDLGLRDYEIFDIMNKASFATLDEFSRYFPSLEDEDENVVVKKYFAARMIDDVLYIKIKTFNKLTFYKMKQTLDDNISAKGLILDLRGNRGGMFSEALKAADLFLDEGSLIVSTKRRKDEAMQTYIAKEPDMFEDKPIVILVDGDTASSAEMLTAALKDQSRATVLGTKTFGKGSVQNLHIISEDKGFALTHAYFYSPQEKQVHKQGIVPDICVNKEEKCKPESRETIQTDIDDAITHIKQYL